MVELREHSSVTGTSRLDAERRVLQVLCQGTPQGPVVDQARASLGGYRWSDPVHQVIFEIVLGLPPDATQAIRDLLPARLTRRGFPDFAIDDLFRPHGLTKAEAVRLIEFLHGIS